MSTVVLKCITFVYHVVQLTEEVELCNVLFQNHSEIVFSETFRSFLCRLIAMDGQGEVAIESAGEQGRLVVGGAG